MPSLTKYILIAIFVAVLIGCWAYFSGPPNFDSLDGTEYVIAARCLGTTHPPGYPLFIFLLRTFGEMFESGTGNYDFYRMLSSAFAGLGFLACAFAIFSFGIRPFSSILAALLFYTLLPVMSQMNVLEIHTLAILLAFIAIAFRKSRCGPYLLSLSVFGGHPISLLLLPTAYSDRYRQKWLLPALLPATLWLFVPIRATFGALVHYSHPSTFPLFRSYLTLYGHRLILPNLDGVKALGSELGLFSGLILLFFILYSRKFKTQKLIILAFGITLLFISVYCIRDIYSLVWLPLIPAVILAAGGIDRLLQKGTNGTLIAIILVAVSAISGLSNSWRGNDDAAKILAEDSMRAVSLNGAYCSTGFITFHTAYLMDVEDRRPDILPLDTYECFFDVMPPEQLPPTFAGRDVYTTRGWDQKHLHLSGLLFTEVEHPLQWQDYDIFRYTGSVPDYYQRSILADIWVIRAIQTENPQLKDSLSNIAIDFAPDDAVKERVRSILEIY